MDEEGIIKELTKIDADLKRAEEKQALNEKIEKAKPAAPKAPASVQPAPNNRPAPEEDGEMVLPFKFNFKKIDIGNWDEMPKPEIPPVPKFPEIPPYPKEVRISNLDEIAKPEPFNLPESFNIKKPAWLPLAWTPIKPIKDVLDRILERLNDINNKEEKEIEWPTDAKKPVAVRLSNGKEFIKELFGSQPAVFGGGGTSIPKQTSTGSGSSQGSTAVPVVNPDGSNVNSTTPTDSYPMYSRRDLGLTSLQTDAAGALQVYGSVVTDEGTGRVNFTGSALSTSPGTATFTNGSLIVTGSGFASADLHYMDYVKLNSAGESAWAQISFVNSDTSLTLMSPYTGSNGSGTYNLASAATVTGTGVTISVASGQLTIAMGTNASASGVVYRAAGAPPIKSFVYNTQLSISQRIANQDIYVGLEQATASPIRSFSRFHFSGTDNTIVKTETAWNPTTDPSASEIESNTITLPAGAVTSAVNNYRIVSEFDAVVFYINDIQVAKHIARLPHIATGIMNAQIRGVNSGSVTNTNIVSNFMYLRTYERLDVMQQGTLATQDQPQTNNGLNKFHLVSTGSSGDVNNIKSSPGQVYAITVFNLNAAARYLKFHNSASAPTAGAGVTDTYLIPGNTAGAGVVINIDKGISFSTGIGISLVTGIADNNSSSVASAEIVLNVYYK